jgi:hypothetical protein
MNDYRNQVKYVKCSHAIDCPYVCIHKKPHTEVGKRDKCTAKTLCGARNINVKCK